MCTATSDICSARAAIRWDRSPTGGRANGTAAAGYLLPPPQQASGEISIEDPDISTFWPRQLRPVGALSSGDAADGVALHDSRYEVAPQLPARATLAPVRAAAPSYGSATNKELQRTTQALEEAPATGISARVAAHAEEASRGCREPVPP